MNKLKNLTGCELVDIYELDSIVKCLYTYPYYDEFDNDDRLTIALIILRLVKQYYNKANRISIMSLLANNNCLEVSSIILLYRHFNGDIEKIIYTFKLLCDYRHYVCITKNYRNKNLDIYKNMIVRYTNEFIRNNKDIDDIESLNKLFNPHLFEEKIDKNNIEKKICNKCNGEIKPYDDTGFICLDCLNLLVD